MRGTEDGVFVKAVMLIDGIQMIIFLAGGILGSAVAFNLVGGMSGLLHLLKDENLAYFPHLLRPPTDTFFPWYVYVQQALSELCQMGFEVIGCYSRPGMLFGIPIVSTWYWCIDQEMAQRVMSGKNLGEAQLGASFAALFKALPVFITGNC